MALACQAAAAAAALGSEAAAAAAEKALNADGGNCIGIPFLSSILPIQGLASGGEESTHDCPRWTRCRDDLRRGSFLKGNYDHHGLLCFLAFFLYYSTTRYMSRRTVLRNRQAPQGTSTSLPTRSHLLMLSLHTSLAHCRKKRSKREGVSLLPPPPSPPPPPPPPPSPWLFRAHSKTPLLSFLPPSNRQLPRRSTHGRKKGGKEGREEGRRRRKTAQFPTATAL